MNITSWKKVAVAARLLLLATVVAIAFVALATALWFPATIFSWTALGTFAQSIVSHLTVQTVLGATAGLVACYTVSFIADAVIEADTFRREAKRRSVDSTRRHYKAF